MVPSLLRQRGIEESSLDLSKPLLDVGGEDRHGGIEESVTDAKSGMET